MTYFSLTGVVDAPSRSPTNLSVSLEKLAVALRERFDLVHVSDRSVEAGASSLTALTFRGRRPHPMLPFERVRLEVDGPNSPRLAFRLNFKMQIVISIYLAIAFGLSASIDSGPGKGLAIGVASGAAFFVLNHLLSRHRAFKWLASQWADALAQPAKPN